MESNHQPSDYQSVAPPSCCSSILLVNSVGNDPTSSALQAVTHPSMSRVQKPVTPSRLELDLLRPKRSVPPSTLRGEITLIKILHLVTPIGFEPMPPDSRSAMLPLNTKERNYINKKAYI